MQIYSIGFSKNVKKAKRQPRELALTSKRRGAILMLPFKEMRCGTEPGNGFFSGNRPPCCRVRRNL